jgi:hypothetical protein
MHTPGPTAEHSLSDAHARHVSVALAQMGVVPAHWALLVQVTHWPVKVPALAQAVLPSVRLAQRVAVQPVQALLTQKPLAALAVQPLLSMHSTHSPEAAPVVAHADFVPVQAFAPAFWQPAQALLTQKPLAALEEQPLLSMHSTHSPAEAPVVAHADFVPVQALTPAFWHPVQALLTQKPLAALEEQPLLSTHSTHSPAEAPLVAHTGFVPVHAIDPAFWQPVHALLTQKPFVGSFAQPLLSTHSTH